MGWRILCLVASQSAFPPELTLLPAPVSALADRSHSVQSSLLCDRRRTPARM